MATADNVTPAALRRWRIPRQRHPAPGVPARPVRLPAAAWMVAATVTVLELAVSGRYGLHRDELYFVVAGAHPALGYVDQPPLAPLLAHATWTWWSSPVAVRVLPAGCAGAVTALAAGLARELGGGRRAMLLAAVATGCAPVLLAAGHLGGTTIYDLLAWAGATLLACRALRTGRRRDWVVVGLVVGVGLWNKDLVVMWAAAVAAGLAMTGSGRAFRTAGPWLAGLTAAAVAAPLLAWQASHGWPLLTMSRRLRVEHSAGGDYLTVLPAYAVYAGLLAAPLAVVGLVRLLRRPEHRWAGVAVVLVAVAVAVTIPGRPYYPDGVLPLLFAAGAVTVERRASALRWWLAAPVAGAVVTLPVVLPVLPVTALHAIPGLHKLNYDAGETVGWPQLVAAVERVDRTLPRQHGASVFTANYGEAGALTVYGGSRLPPVLSGHNAFADWGPGKASDDTVIAVGTGEELAPYFARCRSAATFTSPYGVQNDENGTVIAVCTGPRAPWSALWPHLRHLD